MTPERWREVQALFEAALEISPDDRARYLASACGDDSELRVEVESLLDADTRDDSVLDAGAARALGVEAPDGGAPPADATNTTVGAYRLTRAIGHGGMGEIYEGERVDGEFQQRVAVKLIRHELASRDAMRRFAQERQLLAQMAHSNIARLFDGGSTDDGRPYFVMEFIEGLPLDRYCTREDADLHRRLELFATVCDAVQYAHRHLVVHRDLKPDNILVTGDGDIKLLDFGIAKALDPEQSSGMTTSPRLRLMTPQYAAPEQVTGETVTTATDVYALGVILYTLVAGAPPYSVAGVRPTELATVITGATPSPVSRVAPWPVPGGLDRICERAMATAPEERFASAGELHQAIRELLPAPESRPMPSTATIAAGCFALGVIVTALVAWLLTG